MPILLVGTLDTKGRELALVAELLRTAGLETVVVDAGSLGAPALRPDISREEVFGQAGTSVDEVTARGDRGHAVAKAAEGVAAVAKKLADEGKLEGCFGLGGSAGTTIGTAAMRALPFGMPKVMVSTLASGQTRPYLGGSDIALFPSVADVAGLNRITTTVLTNAANALIGMIRGRWTGSAPAMAATRRPVVAATMFGVTTPCVDRARRILEEQGCEVLVFHATGVGGQAMEGLIRDGLVDGVLDLTTTELADELVGGILTAGPDRLEAAGRRGIPQVVSVGALDMVNFGPKPTVPERFSGRRLHVHNPTVTLMRTTADENRALGCRMAEILSRATGPTVVLIPARGVSALDAPGQPFHDREADEELFRGIREGLAPAARLIVRDEHINDASFAEEAATSLLNLMRSRPTEFLHADTDAH
jgi:uncharacterized protein (UPF0261 family)